MQNYYAARKWKRLPQSDCPAYSPVREAKTGIPSVSPAYRGIKMEWLWSERPLITPVIPLTQNSYFYRILNNENFKMEVKQTNFVTHLIITAQFYHWLSKNPSVKVWSNKFQMVMIKFKFIGKSNERILYKLSKKWNFKVVFNRSCCHGNYENVTFYCQARSFISIFFTCQVPACELQPFSCHDLANDIYSQTAKTVFSHLIIRFSKWCENEKRNTKLKSVFQS